MKIQAFFSQNQYNDDFHEGVAHLIYNEIKNILHRHTHHHEEADRLLKIVQTEKRVQAVNGIIHQYLDKVFEYHHQLKTYLSIPSFWEYLKSIFKKTGHIEYTNQAEGEMLYSLQLINLFKDDIGTAEYKKYQFIFNNSLRSLNEIGRKISQIFQDYANKMMIILTIEILVVTAVLLLRK